MEFSDPGEISTSPVRKQPDRTVIVHVSDLHFDDHVDTSTRQWLELKRDLKQHQADLLIVTGDLVDNPVTARLSKTARLKAMAAVQAYVAQDVCDAANVSCSDALLVVPGNHDYRTQGLFLRRESRDLYWRFFEPYMRNRLFPNLRVACLLFDSNAGNHLLNLASGRVHDDDFTRMRSDLDRWQQEAAEALGQCTRIAVVHHHPMPIGPTERPEELRRQEQFMLLNNAGMFLAEVARARIELVLHGHKHRASYSRVSFPVPAQPDHLVGVLAAGSVGKQDPEDLSYNVITLFDSGQITLDWRRRTEATYAKHGESVSLRGYEEARRRQFERLASTVTLRFGQYLRRYEVADRSGDVEEYEHFKEARPTGERQVSEIKDNVRSDTAIFGNRKYRPEGRQSITWSWLNAPPRGAGTRRGRTQFNPPLRHDRPISYERTGRIFNAFHFNQRDRRDAQSGAGIDPADIKLNEWVELRAREAYEQAVVQIMFPPGRWPNEIHLEALDARGQSDPEETQWIRHALTRSENAGFVQVTLSYPLPGHTYRIWWELPEAEAEEIGLTPKEAGFAQAVTERLLSCLADAARRTLVETALEALRQQSLAVTGGDPPEIALFSYDRERSGLRCVASAGFSRPLSDRVFRPGQGIAGQAFRRRQAVLCCQIADSPAGVDAVYYEAPDDESPPHTVVLAVPLHYPLSRGRRVAVMSLASRSNRAGLLVLDHDKAARQSITAEIVKSFEEQVLPALGL